MSLDMTCQMQRNDFIIDIDIQVASGVVLGVSGENGSGKTTTLDIIAGLIPCTSGMVSIDKQIVDDSKSETFVQPELRGVATVFQGGGLLPHLSVERNIILGRGRNLRSSTRFDELVAAFDLSTFLTRRPHELSGGQCQRVALARAFLSPSRVMLLDEPTTHLDASSRLTVRKMMADLFATYEGTVVLVSHDPSEINELAAVTSRIVTTRNATTACVLVAR